MEVRTKLGTPLCKRNTAAALRDLANTSQEPSGYWRYCYLIGAVFLGLALLMAWLPCLAALAFGCVWAASLLAVAKHLGELAEER